MIEQLKHALVVGITSRTITGFFHDGVEDGWWPRVLAWPALVAVTREPGEPYFAYIVRAAAHPTAARVKRADLRHNLARNGGPHPSLEARYRKALAYLEEETT